jgi:hypothetical protein
MTTGGAVVRMGAGAVAGAIGLAGAIGVVTVTGGAAGFAAIAGLVAITVKATPGRTLLGRMTLATIGSSTTVGAA